MAIVPLSHVTDLTLAEKAKEPTRGSLLEVWPAYPAATYFLVLLRMTSVSVVLGRRIASRRGTNRPFRESRTRVFLDVAMLPPIC